MKHKTHSRRFLSTLLALCMVISMFSGLTLMARAATGGTYQLVTSVSDLEVGAEYLLVGQNSGAYYAMGAQSNNNRQAVSIAAPDGGVITLSGNTAVESVVLGGEAGLWTFLTGDGYLYAASSSGNYLRSQAAVDANAQFSITIDAGSGAATIQAQGSSSRNLLRFNTASSLFACYASGQTAVFLYKLANGSGGETSYTVSVEYDEQGGEIVAAGGINLNAVEAGTTVTLTANAANGYTFEGWYYDDTLDAAVNGNTITFTMPDADVMLLADFIPNVYSITTQAEHGGNILVSSFAETNTWVYVLADPDAGYALSSWSYTYTEGTATREVPLDGVEDGETGFYMPASDVTVKATFTASATFCVDFAVNGNVVQSLNVQSGKVIGAGFPADPEAPEGYAFVGWTTADTVNPDATDGSGNPISYFYADTPVTGDMIVYAVFAKASGAGWELVETAGDMTAGEYVITWNNAYYLPSETAGTGSPATGFGITVDENANVLTNAVTSDMKWTFTGNNAGGFTVSHTDSAGTTQYLNSANSSTGVKVSTADTTTWTALDDGTYGMLLRGSDGGSRNLAVYNNASWRYYVTGASYSGTLRLYRNNVSYSGYTLYPETVDTPNYEDAINAECIVVLNYDRNVNIDVVDYAMLSDMGDVTVTQMLLSADAEEWSDFIDFGNGTYASVYDYDGENPYILFEPTGMSEDYSFLCSVTLSNGDTYYSDVYAFPADVIYCEESNNMFAYESGVYGAWSAVHSSEPVLYQDFVDTFTDYNSYYENCTRYSAGDARKATVSAEVVSASASALYPSVTFSFDGTGFELISAANNKSGLITVEVKDGDGETILKNFVDTYYGCAYDRETGEWTTSADAGTIYQVPVAKYDLVDYGNYTVTVTAVYSELFDHAGQGAFEFIVDGVRIYNPLGTGLNFDSYSIREALLADGTDNTVTYIDGDAQAEFEYIEKCGSAYEVFLAKGQSVAFYVTSTAYADLKIGARALEGSADGAAVKMDIYAVDADGQFDQGLSVARESLDINTATLMHYDLGLTDDDWGFDEDAELFKTKILVVTNNGDGILALSDIRSGCENYIEVIYNDSVLAAAQRAVGTIQQRRAAFSSMTDVDANAWYYNSVKFSVESGIMAGVGNNEFAPNQELTRAMAVRVLYVLAGKPETQAQHRFADVDAGAWYASAVAWGAANGIVAGVSETSFDPNGKLTREQMVAFLYRFAASGQTVDNQLTVFTDREQVSEYAVNAMNWAIANGIVSGMGNGTLAPRATANRAQLATILAGCGMLYAN